MKKFILVFFTAFFILGNNVNAHSILKSTNPEAGEVVKKDLTELVLNFQAKIEEGSKLLLVNEAGENISVTVSVNEKEIVAKPIQTLENGKYSVIWEVASTDGHLLNGEFSFEVALELNDAAKEEATDKKKEDRKDNVNENYNSKTDDQNLQDNEKNEKSSDTYLIYGIVGILIIAVLISIRFIKK
jgi:copper resistance protein C